MIRHIYFVFLYIFFLLRIRRKSAKSCNWTQKFRHFFDFDAAFLMIHKSNFECKNMDKKRRCVQFQIYI
jgi:hypothetical protein